LFLEAYVESKTACRDWFQRFRNGDFDVEDKERAAKPKLVEHAELEALLDENSCRKPEELAESLKVTRSTISMRLKILGTIQMQGNWVLSELKPRDLEKRFFTCESWLQRQKTERLFALFCY